MLVVGLWLLDMAVRTLCLTKRKRYSLSRSAEGFSVRQHVRSRPEGKAAANAGSGSKALPIEALKLSPRQANVFLFKWRPKVAYSIGHYRFDLEAFFPIAIKDQITDIRVHNSEVVTS